MPLAFFPLTEAEIGNFFEDIDLDHDGIITIKELDDKLAAVHRDLAPIPKKHDLNHPDRTVLVSEKPQDHFSSDRLTFLCSLLPGCNGILDRDQFFEQVRNWNIPSQDQTSLGRDTEDAEKYQQQLPLTRRIWAWWSAKGPEIAFIAFVIALQLGFGFWQLFYYLDDHVARAALGWGVVMAKFSAGVLYPSLFFLILSMSRWFATYCRKFYPLSRIINWDLSQTFHITMACVVLFFSCLHAVGHLTGSFVHGSRASNQGSVAILIGPNRIPMTYSDWIATRAGWTGLTALATFLVIAITSMPWFRKHHYEVFQRAHLLMYVIFAMLAIHGTKKILRGPMLGYWLVFPVLLVLAERLLRLYKSFSSYPARLEKIDDNTVVITIEKPEGSKWNAHAGQYVLVQVPTLSWFQWHPFTISAILGHRLQVTIKADGDWTKELLAIASNERQGTDNNYVKLAVGIDGPFGAPTQRFYSFDKSIIIGAGIGVTPFAACLTDLEENYKARGDPWKLASRRFRKVRSPDTSGTVTPVDNTPSLSRVTTRTHVKLVNEQEKRIQKPDFIHEMKKSKPGLRHIRRVDFHWSVRDKNSLLWFADLLNRVDSLSKEDETNLTLNIHAHVTASRKSISTHVFRYLLDAYRTVDFPYSALTGLQSSAHFGRPDYSRILSDYYNDLAAQEWRGRVGVFFCGPAIIGTQLADLCSELTARAMSEGSSIRFVFMSEVFG